jgi:quinol monooxygenase YgiN
LLVAEHASVIRVAHFQPADGQRDALVARLEQAAVTVRAMDGCFGMQVCAVRESPNEVAMVSRWASQAALEQFTAYLASSGADLGDLAVGQARVEHFVPL